MDSRSERIETAAREIAFRRLELPGGAFAIRAEEMGALCDALAQPRETESGIRRWQHGETGRMCEMEGDPGPRWIEVTTANPCTQDPSLAQPADESSAPGGVEAFEAWFTPYSGAALHWDGAGDPFMIHPEDGRHQSVVHTWRAWRAWQARGESGLAQARREGAEAATRYVIDRMVFPDSNTRPNVFMRKAITHAMKGCQS